jgi:uncharacterized glyoxalase superfamily protein PhnB
MTATRSTVIPLLRYRNAPAAIEWLCRVLGFEQRLVVPGPGGTVLHAQLTLAGGMVMLSTVRPREQDPRMRQPDELGGVETHSVCLVVPDADEVYARARAAGAGIDMEIRDADFGGRLFSCRDPEGHSWNVGTYDPWG